MLGQVGAMLELCWPMLAHLGAMLGYVGQLGAKISQHSQKSLQHESAGVGLATDRGAPMKDLNQDASEIDWSSNALGLV